ncbi:site-specific integrase [Rufibacter quisquiliarum]|uniref:Site-specific recombinase XerD n=1 Tax=Rufibacter quisquiliarum TaxID=1549639 RepID=A0A839GQG4_9BACT|nr:site-specific integrase [Rufibacter quisquiliarum]MBA9077116.1 site-specific recombinase XerD [Rufibacter quisquiliarum]
MAKTSPAAEAGKVSQTRVIVKGKLVKLRARRLPAGGETLYLDYNEGGKRRYDFLGLHLMESPKTSRDRQQNRDNQLLAERIRSERELQLSKNSLIVKASVQRRADFLAYLDEYVESYPKKDLRVMEAMGKQFKAMLGETGALPFSEVTVRLCARFRSHLESKCTGSTPYNYFKKFRKVLRQAVKDGLIDRNPAEEVENRYAEGIEKEVLTTKEIQLMANVECYLPEVKRAFLFSCVTGLRFCDIQALEWKGVAGSVIRLKQQKTSKEVVVNLNNTALRLLGEKPKRDGKVFELPSSTTCAKHLQRWANKAEIGKKVTWHCARHSFGTNLLISGADVRSVSGLLGHSSLVETQKYVRLVESLKEKAVERLPEIIF